MTRSLRAALVLSIAAHGAFLLLRIDGEPLVESYLMSLDVRLQQADEHADSAPEPVAASEPTAPPDEPVEEPSPEEPEPLLAERAEAPPAFEEPAATAPAVEPSPQPSERAAEREPAPVESVAGPADDPQEETVPEDPVETVVALQTVAPRPEQPRQPDPAPEEPAQPAVLPTIPFDDREQRMLDRRVADWSATFHRMDPEEREVTWKHRGQAYTATLEQVSAEDDRSIDELLIEIRKDADGETLATELRLKKLAFSNFAQFVDDWDPRVMMHDDEVEGRFHANSEVFLSFTRTVGPVFHGKVTTSFRGINTEGARGGMGRDEMFLGGLETGVRRISLPREHTPHPQDAGQNQVHFFDEDTSITFRADGTFASQLLQSKHPETIVTLGQESAYLVAGPKVALHVKGVVNGRVLLYSPSRIVIEDDLVYAADPEVDPESDDYLGLVSERFINVAESKVTGPGDLIIHASIYAKRRFSVGRFRTPNDGTLIIYGSLTAGSISATEPRYSTKIRFDPRLADARPPSFPMTNRYEVADWEARWAIQ